MTNRSTLFPWQDHNLIEQLTKSYALIDSKGHSIFTQLFDMGTEQCTQDGELSQSINLISVAGYKTRAGSTFLDMSKPAEQDAAAVKKLREAGASSALLI